MLERRRIEITGIVQGVGFRPHVARVAAKFSGASPVSSVEAPAGSGELTGFVGNNDAHVFIEAQAEPQILKGFIACVTDRRHLPPLAHIDSVAVTPMPCLLGEREFRIVHSQRLGGARTLIAPDVATCPECLADMANPTNRRYGYAFTTCTNCGPRLSIIDDLPYDRPNTTMRDFPMCPDCAREYADPLNRRYHAQPISCYACGPHLWIVSSSEVTAALGGALAGDPFAETALPAELWDGSRGGRDKASQDAALETAREALRAGKILALKGIGGFHLMVDASNQQAVQRLRERKHRDGKPFAVMVRDLQQAREILECGELSSEEFLTGAQLLAGSERPIVVLPRKSDARNEGGARAHSYELVNDAAAPGLNTLGVMLAYSPLHQLLLEGLSAPVIATSGNLSNEPLCYTNKQALRRLAGIADIFLLHNRDIAVPVEDSVIQADAVADADIEAHIEAGAEPDVETSRCGDCAGWHSSSASFTSFTMIRRSRGYAPVPIRLAVPGGPYIPHTSAHTPASARNCANSAAGDSACESSPSASLPVILGVGGELKNTLTLVRDGLAFVSAHIGDMGSLESQQAYEAAMRQMLAIHRETPSVIVHDAHPNYATTAWAQRYAAQQERAGIAVTCLSLQHHRAHALALLAEHSAEGAKRGRATEGSYPIIAALDGTGYGDDGAIWGSEIFCVDLAQLAQGGDSVEAMPRLWHLPYFPLVGGDQAVREPWRLALALCHTYGIDSCGLGFGEYVSTPAGKMLAAGLQRLHTVSTSRASASPAASPAAEVDMRGAKIGEGVSADTSERMRAGVWRKSCNIGGTEKLSVGVPVDSVGRYFDAVSAMLGLCCVASYEAQAAVALQEAAEAYAHSFSSDLSSSFAGNMHHSDSAERISFAEHMAPPSPAAHSSLSAVPSPAELIRSIARGYQESPTRGTAQKCAYLFHERLAQMIAEKLCQYAAHYGTDIVGVSGGSAINSLLVGLIEKYCRARGLHMLRHRDIPPNDGGLSLGQAYYGYLWARSNHGGGRNPAQR